MTPSINENLKKLYSDKWPLIISELEKSDDENPIASAYPMLIMVNEEKFSKADLKVMFFGQEPNVWDASNNIKGLMDFYYHFTDCENDFKVKRRGQFWNGIKKIQKSLKEQFLNSSIYPIYNNVIKIGRIDKAGRPPNYIYEIERRSFDVIKEELKILQPDLCLFFSGPDYDNVLVDIFGTIEYDPVKPYKERELSKINIPGIDLALRTYHPNFLYQNNIENYYKAIMEELVNK